MKTQTSSFGAALLVIKGDGNPLWVTVSLLQVGHHTERVASTDHREALLAIRVRTKGGGPVNLYAYPDDGHALPIFSTAECDTLTSPLAAKKDGIWIWATADDHPVLRTVKRYEKRRADDLLQLRVSGLAWINEHGPAFSNSRVGTASHTGLARCYSIPDG